MTEKFPRLSSPHTDLQPFYDVIVIGSGYGASIAASRCARAGQKVCVLERGKEWRPGDFPESLIGLREHFQITHQGKADVIGDPSDLYEAVVSDDITVIQGCGLGGGSLINASVGLDADSRVFEDEKWPMELRDDMKSIIDIDRRHVHEMLRPNEYPDNYPTSAKHKAMEKAAKGLGIVDLEDIGKIFKKTPLFVNFNETKTTDTQHLYDQPACNACGNCCSGCNTGAKNTLNMNYLPDAKIHDAKIFTEISVVSVQRDPYSSMWMVFYKRNIDSKGIKLEEQIVRSKYVILGAGALGSTKILLKSKERGLEISDKIGHNFTGNGDALGFSYHGNDIVNSVGLDTGKYEEIPENAPGPCITSVIDLRALPDMNYKDGMVIEEGTAPGALEMPLKVAMAFASNTLGVKKFPSQKKMQRLFEKLKGTDINKTLAFLCMSHDDSDGIINLDQKSNGVVINWKGVGKQKIFQQISDRLQQISQGLGGTYIINPTWSNALGNQLITVHPLGGCPMADDGENGVVNHKGQVFINDTEDVHPGLYVMDGSILPTSVGVNPVMTISTMAERCMRLLIKDAGWNVDYDKHRRFQDATSYTLAPGIRFTERMDGQLKLLEEDDRLTDCEFTVTIECQDVEQMLEHDPNHEGAVTGTVSCPGLSPDPLTISSGKFKFFSDSKTVIDAKEMIYIFTLTSSDNKQYHFTGKKIIKADKIGEIGLTDTTTLFVNIHENSEDSGKPLANGILKISFKDFYRQLRSIEVINTESEVERIKWKTKFGSFFTKNIWSVYSGMSECKYLDPNALPRVKRPLKTNGAEPVVHKVITKDNVELRLTRYQGGGKGPLVVCHGLGSSTILFTLDTIPKNFLEFFLEQGYDVWLFDGRLSIACPWISSLHNYTIDDIVEYDFPAAVDTVLEKTGEKDVQILAHCVSSVALWGTVLSGRLRGKLRSAIFSQATPIPEGSFMNKLKSKLHLSNFLDNMGIKTVTAYTDKHDKSAWMNCFARTAANASVDKDEQCASDVCHRITFFYGLIYEHENFNVETHDTLHELFGTASAGYFNHLSKIFRANRMVDKSGKDIYLPGLDKNGVCTHSKKELEWIENLNFPIYLFCGTRNESFKLASVEKMYKALRSFHPEQDYEFHPIPGYGHVDHFIGKNACYDVWPGILRFLDKYAENNMVKSRKFLKGLKKTVNAVTIVQKKAQNSLHAEVTLKDLLPEKEIKPASNNVSDDSSDDDDNDDDDFDIDSELADVADDQVAAIRNEIDAALQDETTMRWKRKKVIKSAMHKPPEYQPPEAHPDAIEKVIVEKVLISDESLKREIYVLSDLHLGGEWSKENVPKVKDFLFNLAKIAELYVHAVVLLGDILEMWMTPITLTPPSVEEMVKMWKNDKDLAMIMRALRKMAEDDDVRVYYIRGNHDHEIDEKSVKELFGEKIRFIPGKLIYLINNGSQEYRIRFEHGHDYDLFNCFDLAPVESPLRGKPVGYYISRCAQSSKETYFSDTEMVIQDGIKWFLSILPNRGLGATIADILSKGFFQKRLLNTMFENALDLDITEAACILLEDGNWVRIKELMKYPFIKLAVSKYGSSRVFSMLEGSLGNFGDFLYEMAEDVVVLAHTHIFKNAQFSGKLDRMYYVNSGTWIDLSEQFSYVKIAPPKRNEDGIIQLEFNSNETTRKEKEKAKT